MAHLKIGHVAREAGVSVDTVRFYERRGLLPIPDRSESGYRMYTACTITLIRKAKLLQSLGMTLDEITNAFQSVSDTSTCQSERWRLTNVVDRLDMKLSELQSIRDDAASALERCVGTGCDLFGDVKAAM